MITQQVQNSGFIKIVVNGKTIINDVLEMFKAIKTTAVTGDTIKLLYDLRDAKLDFEVDALKLISQKAEESTQAYKRVRTAFLLEKPRHTAFVLIYSRLAPSNRHTREMFSKESDAIDWLLE